MPLPALPAIGSGLATGARAAVPWLLRQIGLAKTARVANPVAKEYLKKNKGFPLEMLEKVEGIAPHIDKTVPGIHWPRLLGTGILGFMGAGMMGGGEDSPSTTQEDLMMALLLEQLQGAGFSSGPREDMMDPSQSVVLRQDPRAELEKLNEDMGLAQQYANVDFMDELLEENAQLLSQISQRANAMSQFVDPLTAGVRPF